MKERSIGIILGIVNIVFLAVLFFFFSLRDRTAPEITVEEVTLIYREGLENSLLLEGVAAQDEEDGDISESIVIEKIVTDPQKGTAIITYGATDEAGNTAKVSRKLEMMVEDDVLGNSEGLEETDENLAERSEASEEEESEDADPDTEAEEGENNGERSSEEENIEDSQERESEEDADETGNEVSDEEESDEQDSEADREEGQEALPTVGEASNENRGVSSRQDSGRPSIVFRNREVKAKVGGTPAWVDAIEGLHDDKDDYVYLLGEIKVEGVYDRNTPGTYEVKVSTTDSDGNVSNSYPVKIVVEE